MKLKTITHVSRDYGISTRMLRYYEQIGLIQSLRTDNYAYRVYDETAIHRLKQIIILRKMRIALKQINSILNNNDASHTVEIFLHNISEIDKEISSLSKVKSLLEYFIKDINEKTDINLKLISDNEVFSLINALSFSDNHFNETSKQPPYEDLRQANDELMKLNDLNVRIIYLPPMTVASAFSTGKDSLEETSNIVNKFIKEQRLLHIKPDARCFDFDYLGKEGMEENSHGHEAWVSVPDDMELPAPLVKRIFHGGLYAAHVLRDWDFQDWRRLKEWVDASDKYESDCGTLRWEPAECGYSKGFEETLNLYNFFNKYNCDMNYLQLDLLYPIKEKVTVK